MNPNSEDAPAANTDSASPRGGTKLPLHEVHAARGACFGAVNGWEVVMHYGDPLAEYAALCETAGVLDLSFRGRLVLTGADRHRFLNGQVTNDVSSLRPGDGCYAVVLTAKGRMICDLNIYCLPEELLLDFEPGLTATLVARLEKHLIADDVHVTDVAPLYGLLSLQGPRAAEVAARLGWPCPPHPFGSVRLSAPGTPDVWWMNHPRTGTAGFDLFAPVTQLESLAAALWEAALALGGRPCGWQALEMVRIEAGIPRFGVDMDETNLPPEAGLEDRAISYTKGCYIGQEVIARLRAHGQVTKKLCGLRLDPDLKITPRRADKLYQGDREIGYVTSFLASPALKANLALAYVRREHLRPGADLVLRTADGACAGRIVPLPFSAPFATGEATAAAPDPTSGG